MEKQYHLDIISSKADVYGNRYFAMVVTRNSDGKIASGKISGGSSNCEVALKELTGGEWGKFTYTEKEISKKEWNYLFKNSPYLGCTPDEINPNLIKQFESDNQD